MKDNIFTFIGILLLVVLLLFIGYSVGRKSESQTLEYQYINTEYNRFSGVTQYTMIYLQKGELKYLHFDDPATGTQFKKITGMGDK